MPRLPLAVALSFLLFAAPVSSQAGLLSLTVVGGLAAQDGSTAIGDPVPQETLGSSTLAQIGAPALYDPEGFYGLTVRIQNVSDRDIAFPDVLPGVSVLTGITGIPGYSTKLNVAAGGAAGKSGAPGADGGISRTALDMTVDLEALSSPPVGSNGGGGGAATGVADDWLAVTGASGDVLAAYLAGRTLRAGDWIEIPEFVRIAAFGRSSEQARIAIGFDIPTFSYGGITVTTAAWTGAFTGPGPEGGAPSVPEPPGAFGFLAVLAGLVAGGRRRAAREERRE